MKKILLILILLIPVSVNAEVKVTDHLINAEIEIAGALNVKELIIVEGDTKDFSRTINYKNLNANWDKKTINFEDLSMYNGYSIDNVKISAFETPENIDFNTLNENIKDYFSEFDLKKKQDIFYTRVNNDLGATINIHYDTSKNKKTAYYIEYLVTNVIVVHKDISEINYTFKNLNYDASNTLIRVIIPYSTKSELYNFWVHGPSSGELNELEDSTKSKAGVLVSFPNLKSEVNIRMTLPKEQVGIDVYLNHTEKDALNSILEIEQNKIDEANFKDKTLVIIKYTIIFLSIVYLGGSFVLLKHNSISLILMYLLLGLIISLFNFLFRYHIIWIYLIIIMPLAVYLFAKIRSKKIKINPKSKKRSKV